MPPWVFPSRTGTALEERNIRHLFERMLTKAGLQITVDTCRHLIPGANRGAVDRPDDAPAMHHLQPGRNLNHGTRPIAMGRSRNVKEKW